MEVRVLVSIHHLLAWIFCVVFVQYSAAETCGTRFHDVPSSAVRARIVVEGRARRFHLQNGTLSPVSNFQVVFSNLKLFKGVLLGKETQPRTIEVGYFNAQGDPDACISPVITLERPYMIFLTGAVEETRTPHGKNSSQNRTSSVVYRLSSFPVLSSRSVLKQVVEYTNCSRCGRAPTVRLLAEPASAGFQPLRLGNRLELKCQVRRGKPSPAVTWTKDGREINGTSGRVRITHSRKGDSKLRIKSVNLEDAGQYACQAENVVDLSNKELVNISVVSDVNVTTDDHSELCQPIEQSYCLNGGTCFRLVTLARRYCRCVSGFQGERCMDKLYVEPARRVLSGAEGGLTNLEVILILGVIIAASLTVVALTITAFAYIRRETVHKPLIKNQQLDSQRLINSISHNSSTYGDISSSSRINPDANGCQQSSDIHQQQPEVQQETDDLLRRPNGGVPRPPLQTSQHLKPLSIMGRSRLSGTSATLDSQELNSPGVLPFSSTDEISTVSSEPEPTNGIAMDEESVDVVDDNDNNGVKLLSDMAPVTVTIDGTSVVSERETTC